MARLGLRFNLVAEASWLALVLVTAYRLPEWMILVIAVLIVVVLNAIRTSMKRIVQWRLSGQACLPAQDMQELEA